MRKPDEIALAQYVLDHFVPETRFDSGWLQRPKEWDVDWIEDWARANEVPIERAYYILDKWDGGLWNCGVTTRSGWVEDVEQLREIAAEGVPVD